MKQIIREESRTSDTMNSRFDRRCNHIYDEMWNGLLVCRKCGNINKGGIFD